MDEKNYWTYGDYFIFKPEFNEPIDDYIEIIKNYTKLIFSNYDDLDICIKTKNEYFNEYNKNFVKSKFNQPIEGLNNLTQLTELTFVIILINPLKEY